MAYKDKQKQKEATKERTRRYRARQKASQSGGVTRLDGNALVDKFHDKAQHNFDKLIKQDSTKRGKDIKCFEDLPLDVQQSIEAMSKSIDKAGIRDYEDEKSARTERAIHYQHLFPDRYQNRGVA